jgi:hypothetical protein
MTHETTATSTLSPEMRLYLWRQGHTHLSPVEQHTPRHDLPFVRTLHLDACPTCMARHTRRHGPPKYGRLAATEVG